MKKILKILSIFSIIFLIISIINTIYAFGDIRDWEFNYQPPQIDISIIKVIGFVIKLIRNVSIIATVGVIILIGVQTMFGSVEAKSEYQKKLVNVAIGVVFLASVSTIVSFIFTEIINI